MIVSLTSLINFNGLVFPVSTNKYKYIRMLIDSLAGQWAHGWTHLRVSYTCHSVGSALVNIAWIKMYVLIYNTTDNLYDLYDTH